VQIVGTDLSESPKSTAHCSPPRLPVPAAGLNTKVYPPRAASKVTLRRYDDPPRAPRRKPVSRIEMEKMSARPTPLAIRQLESKLKIQFTLIVTDFNVHTNPCPDQYSYITVKEFLHNDPLQYAVVLFCIDTDLIEHVTRHFREVPGLAMHSRRAYLTVSDAQKTALQGIKSPVDRQIFEKGEQIW
jgi:hypothetical protein